MLFTRSRAKANPCSVKDRPTVLRRCAPVEIRGALDYVTFGLRQTGNGDRRNEHLVRIQGMKIHGMKDQ
jgi:hypothetical protein